MKTQTKLGICPYCKEEKRLTKDHIIPQHLLSFIERFDYPEVYLNWREIIYNEDNYEWICSKCNRQKGHKLNFSDLKTIELLQKLYFPSKPLKKAEKSWLK